MSDDEPVQVEYVGPARGVSYLAHLLEEEGLEVTFRPPIETKSFSQPDIETVLTVLGWAAASGGAAQLGKRAVDAAIDKAVAAFRDRNPDANVKPRHLKP